MSKIHSTVAVLTLLILGTAIANTHDLSASAKVIEAPEAKSRCGYGNVHIAGDPLVHELNFCRPLSRVMAYFQVMGFKFEPRFSLITANRVDLKQAHSYGIFDAANRRITIFLIGEKKPWDLKMSEEIYNSIIAHEMVHMAVMSILGKNYSRLPREWHEFIAYSIQVDLLVEPLRDEVLGKYEDATAFENLLNVNPYIYGLAGSDLFSVKAYKTYRAHGGSTFIQDLLRFKFRPPAFIDIFPLSPDSANKSEGQ